MDQRGFGIRLLNNYGNLQKGTQEHVEAYTSNLWFPQTDNDFKIAVENLIELNLFQIMWKTRVNRK